AVVAVAEPVLTDELAIKRSPHQSAERRSVPPGEEAQEKRFHTRAKTEWAARSCHRCRAKATRSPKASPHAILRTRSAVGHQAQRLMPARGSPVPSCADRNPPPMFCLSIRASFARQTEASLGR